MGRTLAPPICSAPSLTALGRTYSQPLDERLLSAGQLVAELLHAALKLGGARHTESVQKRPAVQGRGALEFASGDRV